MLSFALFTCSRPFHVVLVVSLTAWLAGCSSTQRQEELLPARGAAQTPAQASPSPPAQALRPPLPKGIAPGKRPLLPPVKAGQTRSRVEGCLSDHAAGDKAGSRYPVTVMRGHDSPAPVRVVALGTGLVVHYELHHACCLSGEIETRVDGLELRVRVILTGTPCRCMCRSSLATAVGLAAGTYYVLVEVEQDGQQRTVHEEYVPFVRNQ